MMLHLVIVLVICCVGLINKERNIQKRKGLTTFTFILHSVQELLFETIDNFKYIFDCALEY